jgi:hypothetical protein
MRSCLMGVVEEHADTIGDESAPLEDEDSEDQYRILSRTVSGCVRFDRWLPYSSGRHCRRRCAEP